MRGLPLYQFFCMDDRYNAPGVGELYQLLTWLPQVRQEQARTYLDAILQQLWKGEDLIRQASELIQERDNTILALQQIGRDWQHRVDSLTLANMQMQTAIPLEAIDLTIPPSPPASTKRPRLPDAGGAFLDSSATPPSTQIVSPHITKASRVTGAKDISDTAPGGGHRRLATGSAPQTAAFSTQMKSAPASAIARSFPTS